MSLHRLLAPLEHGASETTGAATVWATLNGVRVPLALDASAVAAVAAAVDLPRSDSWPQWMGVETAARYLDVSPQRLRKLVAAGSVPYVQEGPGCRVFFGRAELDRWMRAWAR